MCNQNRIAGKIVKSRQYFVYRLCVRHHCVGYPGKLRYLRRNRLFRIDKLVKRICHRTVLNLYGTDFDYFFGACGKTGSFYIKNHILRVQFPVNRIGNNLLFVIYEVTFHTVQNLYVLAPIGSVICLRESLNVAVVRNCHRFMPPFYRLLDQNLGIGHSVHC